MHRTLTLYYYVTNVISSSKNIMNWADTPFSTDSPKNNDLENSRVAPTEPKHPESHESNENRTGSQQPPSEQNGSPVESASSHRSNGTFTNQNTNEAQGVPPNRRNASQYSPNLNNAGQYTPNLNNAGQYPPNLNNAGQYPPQYSVTNRLRQNPTYNDYGPRGNIFGYRASEDFRRGRGFSNVAPRGYGGYGRGYRGGFDRTPDYRRAYARGYQNVPYSYGGRFGTGSLDYRAQGYDQGVRPQGQGGQAQGGPGTYAREPFQGEPNQYGGHPNQARSPVYRPGGPPRGSEFLDQRGFGQRATGPYQASPGQYQYGERPGLNTAEPHHFTEGPDQRGFGQNATVPHQASPGQNQYGESPGLNTGEPHQGAEGPDQYGEKAGPYYGGVRTDTNRRGFGYGGRNGQNPGGFGQVHDTAYYEQDGGADPDEDTTDKSRFLQIHDLPEKPDEDIPFIIAKLSELIAYDIDPYSIISVARVPSSPRKIRPLAIEFSDSNIRDEVLMAAKKVYLNSSYFYPDEPLIPVYVNEPLTKFFRRLLYETKKRVVTAGYKFCWYKNSRLHVRRDEFSDPINIKTFEDIDKIV